MSIAIIGGNECMEHRYRDLCKEYNCRAKVFTKQKGIKNKIGQPDMVILFTNTVSHKMVHTALSALTNKPDIVRSHSSSISSLKEILNTHLS